MYFGHGEMAERSNGGLKPLGVSLGVRALLSARSKALKGAFLLMERSKSFDMCRKL
jgi:hypothetical protein